jgi:hypothetical protein
MESKSSLPPFSFCFFIQIGSTLLTSKLMQIFFFIFESTSPPTWKMLLSIEGTFGHSHANLPSFQQKANLPSFQQMSFMLGTPAPASLP